MLPSTSSLSGSAATAEGKKILVAESYEELIFQVL